MSTKNVYENTEIGMYRPSSLEEAKTAADALLNGNCVIVNLEKNPVDVSQRIIDYISGVSYAVNGNLQKVTGRIFIVSPQHVMLSGDFTTIVGEGGTLSSLAI